MPASDSRVRTDGHRPDLVGAGSATATERCRTATIAPYVYFP
ncbi:MAG TPA: hypothetical protein VIE37_17575 [Methylomirabilota bacterium]